MLLASVVVDTGVIVTWTKEPEVADSVLTMPDFATVW